MINKSYLNGKYKNCFGCKVWEIEGFEEAITSQEKYIPHHVLEWKYTQDELIQMGRYYNVTPDELIWMPESVHNGNYVIHKGNRLSNEGKKGRKQPPRSIEYRKHISEALKGKHPSEETRKKMSAAIKGRKLSEEHKKKISEGMNKQNGEARKKISETLKGRKLSEEHRKNLSKPKSNSDFGKKYFEHFGYSQSENEKQYYKERMWYLRHNRKCSWEVVEE